MMSWTMMQGTSQVRCCLLSKECLRTRATCQLFLTDKYDDEVIIGNAAVDMSTHCLFRNKCLKHADLRTLANTNTNTATSTTTTTTTTIIIITTLAGRTTATTTTTTTTTTMWMKTCHKAIAHRFAKMPSQAEASAIFKLV
jgi:hypothetical protein